MKIPPSFTPRPGEEVVAYQGKAKFKGKFVGYNTSDGLIIRSNNNFIVIDNHLMIRPDKPFARAVPCWERYIISEQFIPATHEEKDKLGDLLNQKITPGPSYIEFITEIWSRGYETFLVGGAIRDVINGGAPNDVDMVTTMPLNLLEPLAKSMFGDNGTSRKRENGFMSVGLDAADYKNRNIYDPLIDVKNFFSFAPGTSNAQFGADIDYDYKLRDFACNSIYYEPINEVFIDPSGLGLEDAKAKRLNLVREGDDDHPRYKKAEIAFRYIKFIKRGYSPSDECRLDFNNTILPIFGSVGQSQAIALFKKHFFKGVPLTDRGEVLVEIKELMFRYDCEVVWSSRYEKFVNDLLNDE